VVNGAKGLNTPVSLLNALTKDPSIQRVVSLTIAGLILLGILLTVIMNLDQLGLWPWNWPPRDGCMVRVIGQLHSTTLVRN
jgi:hypothetical protein